MPSTPIQTPAGFIPTFAAAYADASGNAQVIGANTPLPIATVAPTTTPLAGTTVDTSVVGPFYPVQGRSVLLVLTGDWSGVVTLMRSTDNGVTKVPVTIGGAPWAVFGSNCCEAVWDESEVGAQLYLDILITSGTLTYRLAQ